MPTDWKKLRKRWRFTEASLPEVVDDIAELLGVCRAHVPQLHDIDSILGPTQYDVEDITPDVLDFAEQRHRAGMERIFRMARLYNERVQQHNIALGFEDDPVVVQYKTPEQQKETKRKKLYGHPATAILRWMGVEDWSYEEAQVAMRAHGFEMAESTIKTQFRMGRNGDRPVPKLTKAQKKELYDSAAANLE